MKFILAFLFFTLLAVSPALAAPSASISLSRDRHFVYLTFSDLKNVSRVSYTLVYDTPSGSKGFEGAVKLRSSVRRSSRRQILGTCSSGKCVYHAAKNLQLDTTFSLRSGGSSNVTQNLP